MKPTKSQNLTRNSPNTPTKGRFLIYCEDKKASPEYFRCVRSELRGDARIKIRGARGEPVNLVIKAAKHKEAASRQREDNFEAYNQVWCVIDIEAPKPHPSLPEAIRKANAAGIFIAAANPCFELWALMHLSEPTAYMSTDLAQNFLCQHKDVGYDTREKSIKAENLIRHHKTACHHAKKLRDQLGKFNPVEHNPATNIDLLVEILYSSQIYTPRAAKGMPKCLPTLLHS